MSEVIALRPAPARARISVAAPYLGVLAAALLLPLLGEDYWTVIATRAAIYWVLVSGLNLVVGFAGQLAIGYVALLTLGAYTSSVLVEKAGVHPVPALLV
jgi:branched-chain amino acid transport system permease protein